MRRGEGHQLRREILTVAHDALEAAGSPSRMTLREIATRVSITVPAIYLHFNDKNDLMRALANDALVELCGQLEAAAEGAGDLTAVGDAYVAYAIRQPAHYRLALLTLGRENARSESGVAAVLRCLEPLVAHHLREHPEAASSVSRPAAKQVAVELFAAAHGIASILGTWPIAARADVTEIVRRTLCPVVFRRSSSG